MDANELRTEIEQIYGTVRKAFVEFELERARPHLTIPEGMPPPDRAQARAMAEFMPDLAAGRFLEVLAEGDRAAYYIETGLDDPSSSEVTVLRFVRTGGRLKLAPGPRTMSTHQTDKTDEEGLRLMMSTVEMLAPFPDAGEDAGD